MKRFLIIAAKLTLAASLLWFLMHSGKIDFSKLKEISGFGWLLLAQPLVALMLGLTFIRWHLLLRAQGIEYRLSESFSLSWIGFFFSQFVPGSTGGDLMKAYYVAIEHPELRAKGITTVIIDRMIGLVVFMAAGALSVFLNWNSIRHNEGLRISALVVAGVLLSALVLLLLVFSDSVRRSSWLDSILRRTPFQKTVREVGGAVATYKSRPGVLAVSFILSVGVQVATVLMTYCYAMALGEDKVTMMNMFFLVPIAMLIMALPFNPPGGLGVGEGAYSLLFEQMGSKNGGMIALVQRINWYAWALIGLIFYLRKKKKIHRAMALGESAQDAVPAEPA